MAELHWNRQAFLNELDGNEELLARLLTIFHKTSAELMAKLKQAIQEGDAETVTFAAHTIKGSAANLDIESIRKLTMEIETAGRANDLKTAAAHLPDLEKQLAQFYQLS